MIYLTKTNLMGIAFAVLIAGFAFYIWRLEKSSENKMQIVDFITGAQGHGDKFALAYTVGLLVSTWGFWFLAVLDRLTEWYFTAYLGAFVLGAAFKTGAQVYAAGKQVDAAAQVPGTVEATTTSDSTKTEVTPAADLPSPPKAKPKPARGKPKGKR